MTELTTMQAIARLIPKGSRVLDLGCGDGALLSHLQRERGCTGYGVELDDANVLACVRRGVNVLQLNLEDGLAIFQDNSFDVGRMPVTRRLPYQWYDTPNIRVGTYKDFEVLATRNRLRILDAFGLQDGRAVRSLPNLMAGTAVFHFEHA
jgi:SAM-dependent methyltransferase